ncbi:MAG: EamA family transporter RarD [Thiolinea sp.]
MTSLRHSPSGLAYGLAAYVIWGFFPLYFHYLAVIPAPEVLAQRIVWSFVFVAALILVLGRQAAVRKALASAATRRALLLSAVLVTINWLTFIWAVAQQRVMESSFGYFLTPLVSVLLARLFLQEHLNRYQVLACVLALLGVGWQLIGMGKLPWVSLTLALSFGFYGLVRKQAAADSLTGLGVETGLLLPFALAHWGWLLWSGQGHSAEAGLWPNVLLLASGVLTALPLLLFASAAKQLSLSIIGFMMYINPTLQFLIGVFVLHEPFSTPQLISFCFIWSALLVFSYGSWRA